MPGLSLGDRFWSHVDRRGPAECWLWTAYTDKGGYGILTTGSRKNGTYHPGTKAHRVAYELINGIIPDGLTIDHLCRNRMCVNPTHLEAVSLQENVRRGLAGQRFAQQQRAKGRCPRGHLYTGSNLYVSPQGHRRCRECGRQSDRLRQGLRRRGTPYTGVRVSYKVEASNPKRQ